MYMMQKQTNDLKISKMDGLSEAEMKDSWHHNKGRVPSFKVEAGRKVEYLTGGIPFRPLQRFDHRGFSV